MKWKLFGFAVQVVFILLFQEQALGQNRNTILGTSEFITIPFEYSQGFIIIDLTFHQIFPMKFILDTGAEHSILLNKETVELLGIPYDKEVKILGADVSLDLKAWVIRKIPIQLMEGAKVIQDMIVLEEDIMNLGAITGTKVDGILGAEFLKHFIVDIDYSKSSIKLFNAGANRNRWKRYEKIPMEIFYNKPYIRTNVGLASKEDSKGKLLLLDTGAALALLLHLEKDSLKQLPSNVREGLIGKGLGGELTGYTGMVAFMKFGSTPFENFVTSFQSMDSLYFHQDKIVRDGIVGNYIMDQFHLVFDFPENRIFVKRRFKKHKPMRLDRSGIILYAFGENFNQYYVHQVLAESPGHEVDVREGDILLKIGIWPVKMLSMARINRILSGKRKNINITLSRDGQKLKKTVLLRDLYKMKSP